MTLLDLGCPRRAALRQRPDRRRRRRGRGCTARAAPTGSRATARTTTPRAARASTGSRATRATTTWSAAARPALPAPATPRRPAGRGRRGPRRPRRRRRPRRQRVVLRPAAGRRLADQGDGPAGRPPDGDGPTHRRRPVDLRNGELLTAPAGSRFGADRISGGDGVDVLWGQDGGDFVSGGGAGRLPRGQRRRRRPPRRPGARRADVSRTTVPAGRPRLAGHGQRGRPSWTAPTTPDGQDDLIGGLGRRASATARTPSRATAPTTSCSATTARCVRTLQGSPAR